MSKHVVKAGSVKHNKEFLQRGRVIEVTDEKGGEREEKLASLKLATVPYDEKVHGKINKDGMVEHPPALKAPVPAQNVVK